MSAVEHRFEDYQSKDYLSVKDKIKKLRKPIIYGGTKYVTVSELCLAEGINRDIFVSLYLTTNLSIGESIRIATILESVS